MMLGDEMWSQLGETLDCWMQVCLIALHMYVEASNNNSFVTMVMPWAIMWFTVSCLKTIMESWSNFTSRAKQFDWRAVAEKFAAPTKGEMFNTYWRFIKKLNSGLGIKGPTLPLQINSVKWIASQITVDVYHAARLCMVWSQIQLEFGLALL